MTQLKDIGEGEYFSVTTRMTRQAMMESRMAIHIGPDTVVRRCSRPTAVGDKVILKGAVGERNPRVYKVLCIHNDTCWCVSKAFDTDLHHTLRLDDVQLAPGT